MKISLIYDLKLRRPACVLLQALYGCGDSNGFLQSTFDAKEWLTAPTEDMQRICGTKEEWERLASASKRTD